MKHLVDRFRDGRISLADFDALQDWLDTDLIGGLALGGARTEVQHVAEPSAPLRLAQRTARERLTAATGAYLLHRRRSRAFDATAATLAETLNPKCVKMFHV